MARHPKIKLEPLREIGWRDWSPIGAGLPADEYDTYLLNAAGQIVNGRSDDAVADYLVSVEVERMGLDPAPGVRERAQVVASAIRAYVQTLGSGDTISRLTETWVSEGGEVTTSGDTAEIDRLLAAELEQLRATDGGWRTLLRHRADGRLWQLDYPQSEMHGGGPRRLVRLDITDPATWE